MCLKSVSLGFLAAGSLIAGCSAGDVVAPGAAGFSGASATSSAARCRHVEGAFVFTVFQFTSPTTAVGQGVVQGDLSGEFHAQYFDIQQRGKGVIQMRARHTITRSNGTITTSDEILLLPSRDPTAARPNGRLEVTGGTGAYAGATGRLHTHGGINLVTLAGALQYKGRVCP